MRSKPVYTRHNQALKKELEHTQADLIEAIKLLSEATYEPGCWLPTLWNERKQTLVRKHQFLLGQPFEAG